MLAASVLVAASAVLALPSAMADDRPAAGRETTVASIDLVHIEHRLRATAAIGTWTKLRLSAAFQSIVEDIERYYNGEAGIDLAALHRRFDALVGEAAQRLRSGDPRLAGTLLRAREAIWQGLTRR